MATINVSRTINAPLSRVWEVCTDIANAPSAIPGILSVDVLSEGVPFGVGFRWRETRRMFGQNATEEMWVTAVEEQASYEVQASSRGTQYVSRYTFTEVPEGTRVDLVFTATPVGAAGKVMGLAMALMPKSAMAKAFAKDLADIAAVCERG